MAIGLRIDVREREGGYAEHCAVCGEPASVRVRLWWPPDHDPPGVPARRVEVRHYCAEHRTEAERIGLCPV